MPHPSIKLARKISRFRIMPTGRRLGMSPPAIGRKRIKISVLPAGGIRLSISAYAEAQAVATPAGMPTHRELTIGGVSKTVPIAYMWKDVISDGHYRDPKTGIEFDVDRNRRAKWAGTFLAMREAGEEVPAPIDHSFSAKANLGYVVGAENVGDRLRLLLQIIGEDAATLALRNRASVYIHPDWVDGKGRKWGDAIVHCGFTPYPVVGGMGEFMPVAASCVTATEAPLFLARDEGKTGMELDPKTKAKLQALAVSNGKTVEEVAAMSDEDLTNWYMGFSLADEAAEGDDPTASGAGPAVGAGAVVPKSDPMALSLAKAQNTALGKKVLALSAFAPKVTDEETLKDRLTSFEERVDGLVEKKRLTPGQATKLKALGKKGDKPRALFLSRVGDVESSLSQDVLAIFADEGAPPPTGSQTGEQKAPAGGTALSTVGDPAKAKEDDKEMTEERKKQLMGHLYRSPAK